MFAQPVPNGRLDVVRRIILINRRWVGGGGGGGGGATVEVRKVVHSHMC